MIFYDEPLDLLAASVSSLIGVVDHLVAVDGAYMLYPDAQPSSDPQQMRLIEEICRGGRVGLTTHTPTHTWSGNEVQKRNHALRLAEAVTREDGWYLIHDADCVITKVSSNWHQDVENIPQDWGAATVDVRIVQNLPGIAVDPADNYQPYRLMYRAVRRMLYGPSHFVVHAPDPATNEVICISGPNELEPVAAYDATHLLKVDHRLDRPEYRRVNARKYYVQRERYGIENYK